MDNIIVNRLLPDAAQNSFFDSWCESQRKTLAEMHQYFAPVPVRQVPMFRNEVVGYDRLREMGSHCTGQ